MKGKLIALFVVVLAMVPVVAMAHGGPPPTPPEPVCGPGEVTVTPAQWVPRVCSCPQDVTWTVDWRPWFYYSVTFDYTWSQDANKCHRPPASQLNVPAWLRSAFNHDNPEWLNGECTGGYWVLPVCYTPCTDTTPAIVEGSWTEPVWNPVSQLWEQWRDVTTTYYDDVTEQACSTSTQTEYNSWPEGACPYNPQLPAGDPSCVCPDIDQDGVCDEIDNCDFYNPDQADLNENQIGDACEQEQPYCVFDEELEAYETVYYLPGLEPEGATEGACERTYCLNGEEVAYADGDEIPEEANEGPCPEVCAVHRAYYIWQLHTLVDIPWYWHFGECQVMTRGDRYAPADSILTGMGSCDVACAPGGYFHYTDVEYEVLDSGWVWVDCRGRVVGAPEWFVRYDPHYAEGGPADPPPCCP